MLSLYIPAGRMAFTGDTRENGQYRTSGEDRRLRQQSLQTALDPGYRATCSKVLTRVTLRQGTDQLRHVWVGLLVSNPPQEGANEHPDTASMGDLGGRRHVVVLLNVQSDQENHLGFVSKGRGRE